MNVKQYENPDWYKLIKVFKAAEKPYKITTGLTIPFLMGAYEILEKPFEKIEDLILSVLNSQIDKYPVIQKCPNIQKHVLMVEEKTVCNNIYKKDIKLRSTSGKNILFISTNAILLGKDFQKIVTNLNLEYSDWIRKKEYSWSNAKGWKVFDEKENN